MSCLFLAGISFGRCRVSGLRRARQGGRMKLTNELNLPQPLVDAVKNDGYTRGGAAFSVTQLLAPPRIGALIEKHFDEIEEDVSSRIWSLFGQAMHTVLERASTTGVTERRLSIEVEGVTVSGGMDRYHDGLLQDYKFVTAYKFKDLTVAPEYEQQLNAYAAILRASGHPVKELQIVGILRDWSKMDALKDPNYPQRQVVVRTVRIWPASEALEFIRTRVVLHKQARVTLPECSPNDQWARPDTWAVMKKGNVRATKVFENPVGAAEMAATNPAFNVVHRPGEKIRCKAYCSVSAFCSQYQRENQTNEVLDEVS